MPGKNDIPIFRNLDGVYYRVIRDGIHVNRCFSDLSEAEQDEIMAEYNAEQLRRLLSLSQHEPTPDWRCAASCQRRMKGEQNGSRESGFFHLTDAAEDSIRQYR